jgi:hypothetical protein
VLGDLQDFPASLHRSRRERGFAQACPLRSRNAPLARLLRIRGFELASTGQAPCSALSSWRLTTSGSTLDNQAKRLSSRLLILFNVEGCNSHQIPHRAYTPRCAMAKQERCFVVSADFILPVERTGGPALRPVEGLSNSMFSEYLPGNVIPGRQNGPRSLAVRGVFQ